MHIRSAFTMLSLPTTALPRFLVLYVALYAAFGTASPFLAAFLSGRGLQPSEIGLVLALGTTARLVAGPIAGRIADRLKAARAMLIGCTAVAAILGLAYLPAQDLWLFLAISIAYDAVLAPISPIADALTLRASAIAAGFNYGWVRGAGSGAFIVGTLISGQLIQMFGLSVIFCLGGGLLAVAALCATRLPGPLQREPVISDEQATHGFITLLRIKIFFRLLLVAAMVLGSHAMHDAFAVIRWRDAEVSSFTISLLWSESVAAEVFVFFFLGPRLVNVLQPAGASALAAIAGIIRWAVLAQTASVTAGAMVEPLHGLTFALLHLSCMRLIIEVVPSGLAVTAQTLYSTIAAGASSALLTLASGPLYSHLGAGGFWVMSVPV